MSKLDVFRPLLVFLLSRRCNLQCRYCNVEAGPRAARTQLSVGDVEGWVRAFASLGPAALSIQLHGGEPLMFDPPIELYAAAARNAAAEIPGSRVTLVGVQTNGLLLDDARIESLRRARVAVTVSLDGPPAVNDANRVTLSGKSSFGEAHAALRRLRAHGAGRSVISVIDEPSHVMPAVRFFIEEGLSSARMNPIRPQGRGRLFGPLREVRFMEEMADAFFEASLVIARHNRASPERWFHEDNIASVIDGLEHRDDDIAERTWTFLVDEENVLWAHPGADGDPALRLLGPTNDPASGLSSALGLTDAAPHEECVARLRDLHARTFAACDGCATPRLCESVAGHRAGRAQPDPLCSFRRRLAARLAALRAEDPSVASCCARRARTPDVVPVGASRAPAVATADEEDLLPLVAAILDDVVVDDDGREYVRNYARWIDELRVVRQDDRVFRQLAALARDFAHADCRSVARALDALATVGDDARARRSRHEATDAAGGSATT